jgi:type IV secretion system protein TrbB
VQSRPSDSYVILEEGTAEVQCYADDVLVLRTAPNLSLWDLVRGTLRRTPDHVIVGEIRGQEAYPFLDSMTTGHGSTLSTLHAGTPRAGLRRLDRLARRAFPSSDAPDQGPLIAEAIDLVVTIRAGHHGRRVTAIAEVHDYTTAHGFELVHPPALAGLPGD